MRFSSLPFLFGFLPITLAIYFAVPLRWRNLALLLTSLVFYGWGEPIYISIMVLSILIDYTHGLLVEKYQAGQQQGQIPPPEGNGKVDRQRDGQKAE